MAWARLAAAWPHTAAASLGSIRATTADTPYVSADSAEEFVVLLMPWAREAAVLVKAWARVAAASTHTAAASLGSMRVATIANPCANPPSTEGSVVLLMAWAREAAAWPHTAAASFGSMRA